tara:strand:- start:2742 stop:3170 length:429 start_codon:yes stop_codon:yes gene_type:complete
LKLIILLFSIISVLHGQNNKIKFDPNKLRDPEPKWPKIVNPINSENLSNQGSASLDSASIIVEGFRVQLFATRDRFNAEKFQMDLGKIYDKKIYVIFEAPNYKVRIGNFIDRKRAEKVRSEFSKKGYSSAWIIRTKIEPINN